MQYFSRSCVCCVPQTDVRNPSWTGGVWCSLRLQCSQRAWYFSSLKSMEVKEFKDWPCRSQGYRKTWRYKFTSMYMYVHRRVVSMLSVCLLLAHLCSSSLSPDAFRGREKENIPGWGSVVLKSRHSNLDLQRVETQFQYRNLWRKTVHLPNTPKMQHW